MSRQKYFVRRHCAHEGCQESARYEYDTLRDRAESERRNAGKPWHCVRHSSPDSVLSAGKETSVTLVNVRTDNGLFWNGTRGFVYGPGFKAFAVDFPEGAKLIVTAKVVPC